MWIIWINSTCHKSPEKDYKIDSIIKDQGHDVLKLPFCICEFNPIEFAWTKIKRIIRENNIGTVTAAILDHLLQETINSITRNDWEGFCKHVQKLVDEYLSMVKIIEEVIEQTNTNSPEISENECESSSSGSSSE